MVDHEIFSGNDFNIAKTGDDWTIWRFRDDEGTREELILTTKAMDGLANYFDKFYDSDRDR